MTKVDGSAPHVSVIIPTFNCARYIGEAVESVLGQTYASCEVIVVDDGSTDETRLVLAPYLDRICYMYQENRGQSVARNHGLRLASAEHIVFLDADDTLLPEALVKQLSYLEARPLLNLVQCGTRLVDQRGETLGEVEPWKLSPTLDLETCVLDKPVQLGSMMLRREWVERIGGFDPDLRWAEDVDLLLRLALAGCKMGWLRQPTVCYRQHDASITQDAVQEAKYLEIVMDKFRARPEVPKRIRLLEHGCRFSMIVWSASRMYCTGQTDHIVEWLRRSLRYSRHTLELTIIKWFELFAEQQAVMGNPAEVDDWMPYFRAAADSDRVPWDQLQKLFRWWLGVWQFYVEHNSGQHVQDLAAYRDLRTDELLALARFCLTLTPVDRQLEVVPKFWDDVQAAGLVPVSRAYEVTGLYLRVFGHASLAREWAMAWCALRRAVRSSVHPRAVEAWLRFVWAALGYLIGQHKGDVTPESCMSNLETFK
ncbi:MAG: glycosyltransferase [Deltaproteobacteria bacterium]|nr:glycosyltransferase [Deltaproteobacteria bacterium]